MLPTLGKKDTKKVPTLGDLEAIPTLEKKDIKKVPILGDLGAILTLYSTLHKLYII